MRFDHKPLSPEERSSLTRLDACLQEVEAFCLNHTWVHRHQRPQRGPDQSSEVTIRLHGPAGEATDAEAVIACESFVIEDHADRLCQAAGSFTFRCDPGLPWPVCWLFLLFHARESGPCVIRIKRPARTLAHATAVSISMEGTVVRWIRSDPSAP